MAENQKNFWEKYWWIFLLIGLVLVLLLAAGTLAARKQSAKGTYRIAAYQPGRGPAPFVVAGARTTS